MLRRFLIALLAVAVLLSVSISTAALGDPPSQAGSKVITGGQRDFAFPVPGHSMLSSCFLDNRRHCALDFPAPQGTPVVASYAGTVIATYNGCDHNYGKSASCCNDGFGNYVVLQHDYVLKSGEHITLYSRYSHLTAATVSVGQAVSKGQQVGTVGSTGYSTGHHLDYQILYGGWSPFREYSIDPYINELLELPEGLYSMNSGGCCSEYVAYVKEFYPSCQHPGYSSEGRCSECGYLYPFESTWNTAAMGIYTASQTGVFSLPYASATQTASLSAGQTVTVNASVTNAMGESWYQISGGYVPKASLTFQDYLPSSITCDISLPYEGQTLVQRSYDVKGTITSYYPLKTVTAYLDGSYLVSWEVSAGTTSVNLTHSPINGSLYFSSLTPGKHTLTVTAKDTTGRDTSTVLTRTFYIEAAAPTTCTVSFDAGEGSCAVPSAAINIGSALGQLPVPELEGHTFCGWYASDGTLVTADTVINADTVLTAAWEPIQYTVTFPNSTVTVSYGQAVPEFPKLSMEGHILAGWFSADGDAYTSATPVTKDISLMPLWKPCQYQLTLDCAGGSRSCKEYDVIYGELYGALPTPMRQGYTFGGWMLGEQLITEDTSVTTAADHTLTALWEANEVREVSEEADLSFLWWLIPVAVVLLGSSTAAVILLRKKNAIEPVTE